MEVQPERLSEGTLQMTPRCVKQKCKQFKEVVWLRRRFVGVQGWLFGSFGIVVAFL